MREEKEVCMFMHLEDFYQNVCCPTEKIASLHAVLSVLTRPVTELTAVVCMAVKKETNVTKVYSSVP